MKLLFESSFKRDIKKIKNPKIQSKIRDVILQCKQAKKLTEIYNLKKLKGNQNFYRIRVGDYRLGIEVTKHSLIFVRCLQRKDIYRFFP